MEHLLEKNQKDLEAIKKSNKRPKTTYFETLIHFYKSNIGAACFALGEAFRNAGLILGSVLIAVVGVLCVYQQHVLIRCSDILKKELALDEYPDYAQTLELSFSLSKKWKKYSLLMKRVCNLFLIITQLGFCSVYFLFIANNLSSILQSYGFNFELKYLMALALIPIISTSVLPNLKYLGM
jgi:solute carrier family 36 (proton-coupled amino acid transporter)